MTVLESEYIRIKYKGKQICQGKVLSTKLNCGWMRTMYLASVDNKYYFNLHHEDITFKLLPEEVETSIDISDVPITLWRDCIKYADKPVYEEYTIHELDKECCKLVNAMNNIQHIYTIGSCSGHWFREYWVDFFCTDLQTLCFFTNLFNYEGHFKNDWYITTDVRICTIDKDAVVLKLVCKHKGLKAYKCADKLAEYLEMRGS